MNGRYDHFWLGQQTRFGRMLVLSIVFHVGLGLFLVSGSLFHRQAPVENIYSVTLIPAPKGDKDVVPTMPNPPKLPKSGTATPPPAEKPEPKPEPEKPKPEPEKPKPKPEPEKPKPEPEKPKPKPEPEKPKPEPEKPKPKPEPEKPKPEPEKPKPEKTEPKPDKKADAKKPSGKEPKIDETEDLGAVLDDLQPVGDMEPLVVAQKGPVTQVGSAINPSDGVEISLGNGVSSSWGAKVNRMIKRSWVEPTNVLLDPANAIATIAFTVAADGRLLDEPEVVKDASDPELGASGVRAVKLAAPFPPLEAHGLSEQRVICNFSLTN